MQGWGGVCYAGVGWGVYMGRSGVGHAGVGWGESCRGGVGCVMQGWGGVGYVGVGWGSVINLWCLP